MRAGPLLDWVVIPDELQEKVVCSLCNVIDVNCTIYPVLSVNYIVRALLMSM